MLWKATAVLKINPQTKFLLQMFGVSWEWEQQLWADKNSQSGAWLHSPLNLKHISCQRMMGWTCCTNPFIKSTVFLTENSTLDAVWFALIYSCQQGAIFFHPSSSELKKKTIRWFISRFMCEAEHPWRKWWKLLMGILIACMCKLIQQLLRIEALLGRKSLDPSKEQNV